MKSNRGGKRSGRYCGGRMCWAAIKAAVAVGGKEDSVKRIE